MLNGETWSEQTYGQAEACIGYVFRDKSLLLSAFTHKTYSNATGEEHNERLEFLGDSVLQLSVTEDLYAAYPNAPEGKLTELRQRYVSKEALVQSEKKLGLMRFLRHSAGESNLSDKTSSSLIEAVAGAIYLDGGFSEAKAFLNRCLTGARTENYKTLLQEYVQERQKSTPVYRDSQQEGIFICTVTALGVMAQGQGASKKAAETAAAQALYEKLKKGNHS